MTANWYEAQCARVSAEHAERARARQVVLTKPAGSLARLEQLAVELAGLQATDQPRAGRAPIVVFAGDHGVTARGVSAYPSAVTVEMLRNFANGGAAISVLARELGSRLTVIDAGTLATEPVTGVVTDKPSRGTADFTTDPAMSRVEFAHALGCGQRATAASVDAGADLLILGEMGIGNTTAAAAIAAALTGLPPNDRRRRHGRRRRRPGTQGRRDSRGSGAPSFPDAAPRRGTLLGAVGGLEIAALAGAIIAAAQAGVPVLVDGFIVSVAALAAVRINPSVAPWLIYSHRSAERGHGLVLDALSARPLLDLSLRLGEGSGAALALRCAVRVRLHNGMATFAEAAVSGPSEL